MNIENRSRSNALQLMDWRSYRGLEPLWFYTTLGLLFLTACCLMAAVIDERLLYGVSVWSKPSKFSLSLAVYFATLLIFSRYLPFRCLRTGIGRLVAASLVFVAIAEVAYITVQGALAEASHWNFTTPFHSLMYSLMGIGATWLVVALVWLGWVIGQSNDKSQPMVLAIVVGLGITVVLGGGFGGYLGGQTSHWVSASATDANGIWLFNWTTDGGDLRVAHFCGLHGMQAVPLFTLLLPRHLDRNFACALVLTFAAVYATFSVYTFVQAIQGQSFIG